MLYVTVGLGEPLVTSTYILGAVAGGYIVAAWWRAAIGDRLGLARVITGASAVYGVGLLAGGLGREWHAWYLALIFLVAIAGGTVMTLAWGSCSSSCRRTSAARSRASRRRRRASVS